MMKGTKARRVSTAFTLPATAAQVTTIRGIRRE